MAYDFGGEFFILWQMFILKS